MKPKILISAPYMLREKEKIEEMLTQYNFDVDWFPVEERLEEKDLLLVIEKYHGILCGDDRITSKVIDAAINLKTIVKWGTGIDSIDKEYAENKGISVHRTPGAFTEPVSDSVLALMLVHVRGVLENDRIFKNGSWDKPQNYTLSEKTIGIIGFGDIGQAVARKLIAFGPKVMVNHIRHIEDSVLKELRVEMVSKEEIFKQCDIVTLHTDLNPTSNHMIDKDVFNKLEKKPFIINTARGSLIKEEDLIDALEKEVISGVGIDVYEYEPVAIKNKLRNFNNVIASCHNTNSSPLYWDAVHKNSLKMMNESLSSANIQNS